MNRRIAVIHIRNLRLRTYIGFNSDERAKQQDVMINAEIRHLLQPAALADDVAGALDYRAISKAIIRHVEQGRFLLLEKLTNDLIGICSRDPSVINAQVTVDKPHALRFADSVAVTVEYQAHANQAIHEAPHDNQSRPLSQAS